MLSTAWESLSIIAAGGPFLVLLTVLIFDVPRYLISTLVISIFGSRAAAGNGAGYSVSVIVPAHNGSEGLTRTIASIATQSANICEVIVVDDGSDDGTLELARRLRREGKISQIIRHDQRTGKSAAVNHAARFARGELILIMDCDAVLESAASIGVLASAFDDPAVAAASGNIRVANPDDSLWTAFQALEYLQSITTGRSFLDILGSIACCSGAFSMFRRSIFLASGGLNVGPGEDLEITLRLRQLGFKVRFVSQATALTQVPVTLAELARQRLRWDRDAVNVRLFMFRRGWRSLMAESLPDTLQWLDFMIFEFYPSLIYPAYFVYILFYFGDAALPFMAGIYLLLTAFYALNVVLSVLATGARLSVFDGLALLGLPAYQAVVIRTIRFYGFATEVLFSSSRHDDFVPQRVRQALYSSGAA